MGLLAEKCEKLRTLIDLGGAWKLVSFPMGGICARLVSLVFFAIIPRAIHSVPLEATQSRKHLTQPHTGGPAPKIPDVWTLDRHAAEQMTNFSRISYCSDEEILNWTCATCQDGLPGFQLFFKEHESSRHVGVYVGYYPRENKAVIAFRGTDYLVNWIQDLMVYKVDAEYDCGHTFANPDEQTRALRDESADIQLPSPKPGFPRNSVASTTSPNQRKRTCRVHSGFKSDWFAVREPVLKAAEAVLAQYPAAEIWVTGHSLGGALASLCALDLQFIYNASSSNPKAVRLVTLGTPRVGNRDFAEFLWEQVPLSIRIVHQNDVVPHLPPRGHDLIIITEFHHFAREVWQTGAKDNLFVQCDVSGEDPSCSNSLPSWDRSVEAHLWYLGWQMHCGDLRQF